MQIDLTNYSELMIRQKVERLEAITGFETANRYTVMTEQGDPLLHAQEESSTISRIFLKGHRPLILHVTDLDGNELLTASRSFYWFFSHLHVSDGSGRNVGSLQRRFSFPSRKLTIEGSGGRPVAEIRGPLLRPKTFMIYRQEREVARVTKQWSGLAKEMFTDADTFRLELNNQEMDEDFALLMLASAFAIDLDFFEDGGG